VSEESLREGYEVSDVPGSGMVKFYSWFLVTLMATTLLVYGFYAFVSAAGDLRRIPVWNAPQSMPSPALPRLQIAPHHDLRQFEAAEREWLSSYGWTDAAHGFARIPVEEAEQIVLSDQAIKMAPLPPPQGPRLTQAGEVEAVPESGPVSQPTPTWSGTPELIFPPGSHQFAPDWTERETQGLPREVRHE
jgi:hypothetical protein